MNKKIIGIVVAVVLALGIAVALNYNKDLVDSDKENKKEQISNHVQENIENDEDEIKADEDTEEIAIGKLAPDFTLKNLEGKEVSLSDYKGKIVLINFWATWCKYCDIEMPDLNEVDKENDDVVVLAVNVNEKDSVVKKYIEKGGYGFEVVLDNEPKREGEIAMKYLVGSYPTTYAVDKEGILVGGVPGMLERDQMDQIIERVRTGN